MARGKGTRCLCFPVMMPLCMELSVCFVDNMNDATALHLGLGRPKPPYFVLMFMRTLEAGGRVSVLVRDLMTC